MDIELDNYYLGLARYVSKLGNCPTKQVGAVVVMDGSVLAVGANRAPKGTRPCGDECSNRNMGENTKVCRAVHAEVNAILDMAARGVSPVGASIYVTISPCQNCARAIIQSGIKEVIAASYAPYEKAIELLKEAGVSVKIISTVDAPKFRLVPEIVIEE